jgi:alanine racemase
MPINRREFLGAAGAVALSAQTKPLFVRSKARARAVDAPVLPPGDRFDPWVEVEAAALDHNIAQVHRLSGRPILAVVKNNAYGLSLDVAARLLEPKPEIHGFAVVRTDEAIALRDAGVRKPVLLMAHAAASDVPDLAARDIEIALFTDDDATRLAAVRRTAGRRIPAHFYIDTGMGRMGIRHERALPWMRRCTGSDTFEIRGTMTEFTEEADFDREQLRRFTSLAADARAAGVPLGGLHAASSNGVYHLPEAHLDMVRPGMALWGGYPSRPDEERAKAELRPSVRLRARVVRVERLNAGDGVSYGRNYIATSPVWTATLPVGHVDGYPQIAVKGARILIGGRLYPVIGAVSASHCIIEIGDRKTVEVGEVATFLGPDDPAIHPNAVATATDGSVYNLFMHLQPKLPRFVL